LLEYKHPDGFCIKPSEARLDETPIIKNEPRPLYPYNYLQISTSMLLIFNKNKQISLLTMAIIITISLSFLPLNNEGHASALFPFSAEPVFAQLSGRHSLSRGPITDHTFFFILLLSDGFRFIYG
jgi:hypothetical protein